MWVLLSLVAFLRPLDFDTKPKSQDPYHTIISNSCCHYSLPILMGVWQAKNHLLINKWPCRYIMTIEHFFGCSHFINHNKAKFAKINSYSNKSKSNWVSFGFKKRCCRKKIWLINILNNLEWQNTIWQFRPNYWAFYFN